MRDNIENMDIVIKFCKTEDNWLTSLQSPSVRNSFLKTGWGWACSKSLDRFTNQNKLLIIDYAKEGRHLSGFYAGQKGNSLLVPYCRYTLLLCQAEEMIKAHWAGLWIEKRTSPCKVSITCTTLSKLSTSCPRIYSAFLVLVASVF